MSDDLISRQAAIDEFDGAKVDERDCTEYDIGYNDGIDFAVSRLSVLPSAQPERKTGKWLIRYFGDSGKCSVCGMYCGEYDLEDSDRYCRCCGAKMEGLENEKA